MGIVDSILEVAPKSGGEFTLDVLGVTLHFRRPNSYAELRAYTTEKEVFAANFAPGKDLPAYWASFKGVTQDVAGDAFSVAYWAIEPTPISHTDALRLITELSPLLAHQLVRSLAAEVLQAADIATVDAVEKAKKALRRTGSGESGSPSAETSMDGTPTP